MDIKPSKSGDASGSRLELLIHDVILIGIMAVLAACGLIYEYLLSHYAGRILGAVETAIYAMIGIMIVSMGLGAFAARIFKSPFTAFAWLEGIIALLGMSIILIIAILIAIVSTLPQILGNIFNLPADVVLDGQLLEKLRQGVLFSPYIAGFVLGFLIGMEIPLIARVRQTVYGTFLENNAGTIYGADYIGAGIGAAIWVSFMLSMEIIHAAMLTASLNIIAGWIFLWRYFHRIKQAKALIGFQVFLVFIVFIIHHHGNQWMQQLTNVLYKDRVVYASQSNYQHIAITQRNIGAPDGINLDLYLNGRLQFSSADEHIYHSMLVYPALAAANRQQQILIIGGGDGLALRNVLRWDPEQVTLIDLDGQLIDLFSGQAEVDPHLSQQLTELNQQAFADPRVQVIIGDAFIEIDSLLKQGKLYDSIIIDLPDPSHPDLNKLYSDFFYRKVARLLHGDGSMMVQSTSPYHAKNAFISIGKTVEAAGFAHVEQLRQNVPSFGEWGWTLAVKTGQKPSQRIKNLIEWPLPDPWLNRELILASFIFPNHYYHDKSMIKINYLGSSVLFHYHHQAWQQDQGLYFNTTP